MSIDYYNEPIIHRRRKGTVDDPFIEINETLRLDGNAKVILTEIPNEYNRVRVTGDNREWYEITEGEIKENQFKVDYKNKIVTFHISNAGKQLTFEYLGEGMTLIPVSMIYTEHNGDIITTLSDYTNTLSKAVDTAEQMLNEEDERIANENERIANENDRKSNESTRQINESVRQTNETTRINNENIRQSNEEIREQQEAQRQTDTANAIANAQQAITDANNAANNANEKANLADQKANLAQEKIDALNTLETNINEAITNANEAANNTNSVASNMQTLLDNTKFIEPYNPETTYQKNNIVSYNGSSFIAKQTTTGNTPVGDVNDIYWGLLAQRGADGKGSVGSVNNILPDVNGNVNISASDIGAIPSSQKGVPNGVAKIDENGRVLDGNGNVVEGKVTSVNGHIGDVNLNANDVGAISISEKGVANGVALLNADGKVVDSNGNLVEGKVTSVNGQIGDVNITATDVGAETPDGAQAKADQAETNAKNYTDQQISGKVSTQAVMLRNTTTITTVESSVSVGIADYNPSTDFLLVVKNSVVLTEGDEYTVDTTNKAIVNTQGSWDGATNPINFLFIVYKNVVGSIDYYDGALLLDGTVTDSKLASDNKIGSLAELTTTDKTSVVNAINENKQQIDLHTDDTTIHITSAERTAWNQTESNAKAYTDTAPEAMQRNLGNFNVYKSGKDSNGVFTTVEYKRPDGTLYASSVLSNADTNGNYQTRTITYYGADGTTVVRTDTWTLTYDEEGDLTSEVKA